MLPISPSSITTPDNDINSSSTSPWRASLESARSYLSNRVARLRQLEADVSKKEAALRKLRGGIFNSTSRIVVGVCAMEKKATCKPMREILGRLPPNEFEIKVFEERVILEDPVECWPICDCLIAFYSTGYPQSKVEGYVKLRKPYLVNDLEAQRLLWDRRTVYKICIENDIPVPNHIIVSRDQVGAEEMVEGDDYVEIGGKRINKPFVEKPVDADCHEVFIYYPKSSGGGRKELFRKIGDRSSEFYIERSNVRRDGSFIYEEFLTTEGTDVKVYAVTMDYAHAEARKSPAIDGRVMRDDNNVEVRYPVILSNQEKDLARKVVKSFRQNVCGFDMLRSGGRSYVCDVNGWSFVKRSARYHKDSSLMLARLIRTLMGRPLPAPSTDSESEDTDDDNDLNTDENNNEEDDETNSNSNRLMHQVESSETLIEMKQKRRHEELRAVIAIVRHGDRTPKQKLKMIVTDSRFLKLFSIYGKKIKQQEIIVSGDSTPSPRTNNNNKSESDLPELKLKTAKELGDILRITNEILTESKLQSGIISPVVLESSEEEDISNENVIQYEAFSQVRAVLEMHGTFRGINRKVQLRCTQVSSITGEPIEAQLILKWGGVLTPPGRERAELLGRSFRERMYPGIDGLIRLHSTYRHDLKIYASDEGRVQVTAAAFAKGLLDLEGHLTPILESLVKKGPEINLLLHDASLAQPIVTQAKLKLKNLLTSPPNEWSKFNLPGSVVTALNGLGPQGPIASMSELHEEIIALAAQLKYHLKNGKGSLTRTKGSVTATAFRGLRARSSSLANNSIINSADSSVYVDAPPNNITSSPQFFRTFNHSLLRKQNSEDGGAAAASLGSNIIDLDSNAEKSDRGDGAVSVRDLFHLACARWEKLQIDFFRKDVFDISKIPDIYDCAKYDITHNPEMLKLQPRHLLRVFELSKYLADAVVPQEYGETSIEKFEVGIKTCSSLLGKIREDLRLASEEGNNNNLLNANNNNTSETATDDSRSISDLGEDNNGFAESGGYRLDRRLAKSMGIKNANRHVRTRLYFTSESHLHAVLNVLRYAHIINPSLPKPADSALKRLSEHIEELSYLCNIVLRLYEVTESNGMKHHSLRIYVSDGVSVKVIEPESLDGGDVIVIVGTQPEKHDHNTELGLQPPQHLHYISSSESSDLHSSGFGFSSFHQNIPISPASLTKKTVYGNLKVLPPANPMIPLWSHLPLSEGMKLFDPTLIDLIMNNNASSSIDSTNSPIRAASIATKAGNKGFPLQRFDSSAPNTFHPSWSTTLDEEVEDDVVNERQENDDKIYI